MSKAIGKPNSLRFFLLVCGLAAIVLTVLGLYPAWHYLLKFPAYIRQYLLFEIWMLVSYWPRFAMWIAQLATDFLHTGWRSYFIVYRSPMQHLFPLHLAVHMGAIGLSALYASSRQRSLLFWAISGLLFPTIAPIVLALLKPKIVTKNMTCVCAHCKRDGNRGKRYLFYYGKRIIASHDWDVPFLGSRSTYRIVGTAGEWICHSCVINRYALLFIVTVIPSAYLYFEWSKGILGLVMILLLVALVVYIFRIVLGLGGLGVIGQRLAIDAGKKKLKKAGYDSFFDSNQYQYLESSKNKH